MYLNIHSFLQKCFEIKALRIESDFISSSLAILQIPQT